LRELSNGTKLNKVYYEDCIKGMRNRLPRKSVDLIIADPPFGIGYFKSGDVDGSARPNYKSKITDGQRDYKVTGYVEIPREEYEEFTHKWIKSASRVLKKDGTMYIVNAPQNIYWMMDAINNDTDLIDKAHLAWFYSTGIPYLKNYTYSHHIIVCFVKDLENHHWTPPRKVMYTTFEYYRKSWKPDEPRNVTSLPLELVNDLIETSSGNGDVVLDPFMGGGTTAASVINLQGKYSKLKRNYIGFEMNKNAKVAIDYYIDKVKTQYESRGKIL